MPPIPPELSRLFEGLLVNQNMLATERSQYHKWFRFYLGFCNKYRLESSDKRNFAEFTKSSAPKINWKVSVSKPGEL
jgi:hypothetical protein